MNFLQTIAAVFTALVAIVGGGFTLYKLLFKKWLDARTARRKALLKAEQEALWSALQETLMQEMQKQNVVIKEIRGQVFPNGGGSIIDMQKKTFEHLQQLVTTVGTLSVGQRNILDILDVPSWESDENGRFTFVNTALCELVGATPAELLGLSWTGRVAFYDRDKVVKEWRESVENASDFNVPYHIKRFDHLYQKVQPSVIHNKNADGKVLNSLGRLVKVGEPFEYKKKS